MIVTTAKLDKTRPFSNLEEYVDSRIIDTGASFVDTLMRFGMGILLTAEEERYVAPIVKPCYAALGLANDCFSFDVDWQEFQSGSWGKGTMTNLVWLFMQWDQVDVQEAKRRVREVTNRYENEYKQHVEAFLAKEGKGSGKLKTYLNALGHQIPGNFSWSLRCPRYHPGLCDEASVLLERDRKQSRQEENGREAAQDIPAEDIARRRSDSDVSASNRSSIWPFSNRSSISSAPSDDGEPWSPELVKLGEEYTGQKGFCEDLDEGKFSFPLIHALSSRPKNLQLRGILQRSRIAGGLDISLKQCALDHIHQGW